MAYQFTGAFKDSLINLMAGFGVPGRDKAATGTSFFQYIPLTQFELESAYRSNWMARKLIDIPAQDATRAWRIWQDDTNVIEKLEEEETRLDVQVVLKNALTMARLYGGAAIILGVKGGKADQPLDYESVGKGDLEFIAAVSRWALGHGPIIKDVMDPLYGKPEYFTRNMDVGTVDPMNSQFRIHPSRVIMLKGMHMPDPVMQGEIWGDSVLQNVQDAVHAATLVTQSIATLVTESKFDIIKIPDLSQNIATAEYQNRLTARFVYANSVKSVINTLLLDKEEEWDRINANFTQLPDILQMYLLIVSGAADIPATRMLGQSPAGLQSTGESDVRNYYDRINSDQTNVLSPALAPLDDVLIRSALGKRDPSLYYIWTPLWQMPATEKATVAKLKADVTSSDAMAGLIDLEALRIGRQNQLIEDGTYPGLEQALEEQEQLDLESMESPEEQEAQAEAQMRKEMMAGAAQGNVMPGKESQGPGGQKPGGGGMFGKKKPTKDARPISAARLKLRRKLRTHDEWEESKHPRGQPDNAGKFGPGGGGAKSKESTSSTGRTSSTAGATSQTAEKLTDITGNMEADYDPAAKQPHSDLDSLYEASKKAEPAFQKDLEEWAQPLGGVVTYAPKETCEPGTRLKKRSSSERKTRDFLNGDASGLRDVMRATVVGRQVVDCRKQAADFIATHDVITVKDRFLNPQGGYRDMLINYRTPEGLIAEVQFNTDGLLRAKEGEGHKLYEEMRAIQALPANKITDEQLDRLAELKKMSQKLYDEAYNASGDGCGWLRSC